MTVHHWTVLWDAIARDVGVPTSPSMVYREGPGGGVRPTVALNMTLSHWLSHQPWRDSLAAHTLPVMRRGVEVLVQRLGDGDAWHWALSSWIRDHGGQVAFHAIAEPEEATWYDMPLEERRALFTPLLDIESPMVPCACVGALPEDTWNLSQIWAELLVRAKASGGGVPLRRGGTTPREPRRDGTLSDAELALLKPRAPEPTEDPLVLRGQARLLERVTTDGARETRGLSWRHDWPLDALDVTVRLADQQSPALGIGALNQIYGVREVPTSLLRTALQSADTWDSARWTCAIRWAGAAPLPDDLREQLTRALEARLRGAPSWAAQMAESVRRHVVDQEWLIHGLSLTAQRVLLQDPSQDVRRRLLNTLASRVRAQPPATPETAPLEMASGLTSRGGRTPR